MMVGVLPIPTFRPRRPDGEFSRNQVACFIIPISFHCQIRPAQASHSPPFSSRREVLVKPIHGPPSGLCDFQEINLAQGLHKRRFAEKLSS
jgi:hypothetical protein